jgi:hypothetical protein
VVQCCVEQGLPDATILGAGSWDALYFHDTAHLTAESHGLLEALSSRGSSPLCDRAPGSPAVDAPLPAVYWINQPRPVRSRLKTEEKRQYLTEHSMVESNKAVAEVPADKSPFAAVIDLYEVRKCLRHAALPPPPHAHSCGVLLLQFMALGCGAWRACAQSSPAHFLLRMSKCVCVCVCVRVCVRVCVCLRLTQPVRVSTSSIAE